MTPSAEAIDFRIAALQHEIPWHTLWIVLSLRPVSCASQYRDFPNSARRATTLPAMMCLACSSFTGEIMPQMVRICVALGKRKQ